VGFGVAYTDLSRLVQGWRRSSVRGESADMEVDVANNFYCLMWTLASYKEARDILLGLQVLYCRLLVLKWTQCFVHEYVVVETTKINVSGIDLRI
jgi:hypothetical protein